MCPRVSKHVSFGGAKRPPKHVIPGDNTKEELGFGIGLPYIPIAFYTTSLYQVQFSKYFRKYARSELR
ncbi:hypothetical protein AG1IA_01978 [Rhizoctonia solani AG-1 IA]|uniref:Uncharacterized protein n=1 Tax=Thanatephorus cucumeris (strain AG1-IA) TaxID=983506 RepID=L8X4G1_THACA|nr:hypothetical protein AG1IA_01978 [Rhizoctonia solani AG-1 IA]